MTPIRIERPYRSRRTGAFEVTRDPDEVFALMCPVREHDWVPGWTTNVILSASGAMEQDCVFTTPTDEHDGGEAVWTAPVHDAGARRLVLVKTAPGVCVTRIDISVASAPSGSEVAASYQHTALSDAGRAIVDAHTEEAHAAMMERWRVAIEAAPDARDGGAPAQ